jgi:MoaA/NifB/PqqE/SkfB family radical SAM enzyme
MFCPNPFSRMEVKSNGAVYGCCEGWMPKPMGNVLETPLMDIWEGAVAQEIRESIIDGSFRFCTACPYLPGPGGPVVATVPAAYQRSSRDSSLKRATRRITTLKMDYDQSCNLTCPSCRTAHSNQFVDLSLVGKIHEAVLSSGVFELVDQLYITGAGDPFASPVFWPLLKNFPKTSSKPRLFLHTNGQLFDESHWNEMSGVHDMVKDVGISVDAASEKTYIVNRRAPWAKLWNNVAFINRLQKSFPITLGMFFTVQANNFAEIVPFTRLAFNHNVAWISITALRNWGTYTETDYAERAVHVPGHPLHEKFKAVLADLRLADKRIILDSFKPEHNVQQPLVMPQNLLKKV